MNKIIKQRLDDYLEFDSYDIFKFNDYVEIFGGAIRDSIANTKIHDIDILCMRNTAMKISKLLENNGYKNVTNKLSCKDIENMYSETHIVFEPWTFMNKNMKIVQLIRPSIPNNFKNFDMNIHINGFYNIMREVDISCCGVSWDGEKVNERFEDAIKHCKQKIFTINKKAKMYNDSRIYTRTYKLKQRGWININDMTKEERQIIERRKKLHRII